MRARTIAIVAAIVLAAAAAQSAQAHDFGIAFHYSRGPSYCYAPSYPVVAYPPYAVTYSRAYYYRPYPVYRRYSYSAYPYPVYRHYYPRPYGRHYGFRFGYDD